MSLLNKPLHAVKDFSLFNKTLIPCVKSLNTHVYYYKTYAIIYTEFCVHHFVIDTNFQLLKKNKPDIVNENHPMMS